MTMQRPKTVEEFRALPVGPAFGQQRYEITADDRRNGYAMIGSARYDISDTSASSITIPVVPEMVAFYSDPTDIVSVTDGEAAWMLGRYADGSWFRRRC